ncbi:dienelactone hydrolase family protein [soil metagenome]
MEYHREIIRETGVSWAEAEKALIMIHGRGATAEDIISLKQYLNVNKTRILAPQATNHTWYPYGFMMPLHQNEPWLSSAIDLLDKIVKEVLKKGFSSDQIFILGFSQGACLALEYPTRNARRYGGIISFTGGLIGDKIYHEHYDGDFKGTPVFIGNSDQDPHVPVERSQQSQKIMESMGAKVTLKIYPGMPHTINEDEIQFVNENILM